MKMNKIIVALIGFMVLGGIGQSLAMNSEEMSKQEAYENENALVKEITKDLFKSLFGQRAGLKCTRWIR